MARGKTLLKLLDDLRVELKLSLNPAHNNQVRDSHVRVLQTTYEWLWHDFDWPHLRIERSIPAQAGQRFYEEPEDIPIERIEHIQFKDGDLWCDLRPGIGAQQYNIWDSELDQRSWPITRWRLWEDEQIELWPIADDSGDPTTLHGYIKFIGISKFTPIVDDADRADLDDTLIVKFAASELLDDEKKAQRKLQQAQARYARIRGELMPRARFRLFGSQQHESKLRGPPRVYYRTTP